MKPWNAYILFIFTACLISVGVTGCTKNNVVKNNYDSGIDSTLLQDSISYDTTKIYSFLALGDSYTIGQGVTLFDRFPVQTINLLAANSIKISSPLFIATTGWTTNNLLSAIAVQNPAPQYDIVTLLIGVNDQYQHVDTSIYRIRFKQCLLKAVELAKGKSKNVYVLSIPDYSATPFVPQSDKPQVSREIDSFNAINRQITLQNNITYVDITAISRFALTDSTLIANDGLHPSAKQYKMWSDVLAPLIKKNLK